MWLYPCQICSMSSCEFISVYVIDNVRKERPDTLHPVLCCTVGAQSCPKQMAKHYDVGA